MRLKYSRNLGISRSPGLKADSDEQLSTDYVKGIIKKEGVYFCIF
jgi:hypothetical protein